MGNFHDSWKIFFTMNFPAKKTELYDSLKSHLRFSLWKIIKRFLSRHKITPNLLVFLLSCEPFDSSHIWNCGKRKPHFFDFFMWSHRSRFRVVNNFPYLKALISLLKISNHCIYANLARKMKRMISIISTTKSRQRPIKMRNDFKIYWCCSRRIHLKMYIYSKSLS